MRLHSATTILKKIEAEEKELSRVKKNLQKLALEALRADGPDIMELLRKAALKMEEIEKRVSSAKLKARKSKLRAKQKAKRRS